MVCGALFLSACNQLLEYEVPPPQEPSEPSPTAGQAPLGIVCGVENAELVAEAACAYVDAYCETVASCCDGSEFPPVPAWACSLELGADCMEGVRANLAAGSCFDFSLATAECDDAYQTLFDGCRAQSPLSRLYEDYSSRCLNPWTTGELAPGESCQEYGSQCAAPDEASIAYCFRDFATDSEQPVCQVFTRRGLGESCAAEDDTCVEGTCNSDRICAKRKLTGETCGGSRSAIFECDSMLCEDDRCADFKGRDCSLGCGRGVCGPEGVCVERPLADDATCSIGEDFVTSE